MTHINCFNSYPLGCIELTRDNALNALSSEMIESIQSQLALWVNDSSVLVVVIYASNKKAFSSGGDIRYLYDLLKEVSPESLEEGVQLPYDFLRNEYEMDHTIHHYSKPVIILGRGLILGGGLGLFSMAHYSVLLGDAFLGMPEALIGFYPDAGMTNILREIPKHWAYFWTYTSEYITSDIAYSLGVSDYWFDDLSLESCLKKLMNLPFQENNSTLNHEIIKTFFDAMQLPISKTNFMSLNDEIEKQWSKVDDNASLSDQVYVLSNLSKRLFSEHIFKNLTQASPLSLAFIHFQILQSKYLKTVPMVFEFDLLMSKRFLTHYYYEFQEGIRARLVNKDNDPKWFFPTTDSINLTEISAIFDFNRANLLD